MSGFMNGNKKEELIRKELDGALGGALSDTTASSDSSGFEKVASVTAQAQNPYPSPYLNLSDMQLPQSTIDTFKWCKYYYTFDPLISGAINALATFPVTEVHLEDDKSSSKEKNDTMKLYEKVLFKKLNIYKILIEIGIDYFLYGNCFVMGEFTGTGKDKEWKQITRLDPSKMIIDYNPATGEKKYRWTVPQKIKDIVKNKAPKEEYEKIPDTIRRAVLKNKSIVLNPEQVYHFSRATDSLGDDSVWGVPIVANVLKLLMYRNVLRQAQEAIAREHIVPMRIYYLDRTNSVNIQADWNAVATDLAGQIKRSVRDPNHKIVSPVPVNVINVGGEGRSLLLGPEIEQIQSEILAGMNVPREFIFGGVSYSGSSISLRILENQFITYRLLLKDFLQNFVIRKMARVRGEWLSEDDDDKLLTVKLTDLKMQDDVQQKQLIIQLNGAGKCSNDYMWKAMGIDADKMREAIEQESLEAIELESKAEKARLENQLKIMDLQEQLQFRQAQMQMKLQMAQMQMQQQMQAQMAPQEGGVQDEVQDEAQDEAQDGAIDKEIQNVALKIVKLPQEQRDQYLSKVPAEVKAKVVQAVQQLDMQNQGKSQTDMRPAPEQRPPRREGS